MIDGILT